MSEQTTAIKEKKKRIRKPAATPSAKVLAQATELDLEEKIVLRDELNKQLDEAKALMEKTLTLLNR